jgi:flavorubredoxin
MTNLITTTTPGTTPDTDACAEAPNAIPTHRAPRHEPVEIARETWVIQATHGEGVAPQAVHVNAMVIRGSEPVVVDTSTPLHTDQYLEDLFSIVEPADVRWVFITHDDVDHYGNLRAVMAACPNATLVASWFICERLADQLVEIPPFRWRWVGDGGRFDVGDRTLAAVRPPLYDSPTTRGLFDPTTGVYWASDCFATPVTRGTAFVADLDPSEWEQGFTAFQHWNSPWLSIIDRDAYAMECRKIEELLPRTIAGCHGPTIETSHVPMAFGMLRSLPDRVAPQQPDQQTLDQIVASMSPVP